ncbi:hypothetical protein XENOCAPTIV_005585 [Xenoophorus captivus]|uniref:Uncharacterized protein n=1 Tax=Xenoophorus captivus TaxID=1517983 RepID=A0ABV0RQD5_9TELE
MCYSIMSEDPAAWWWNQQKTYALLLDIGFSHLCGQASSTPSTAGETLSGTFTLLPERVNMIFQHRNWFSILYNTFQNTINGVCYVTLFQTDKTDGYRSHKIVKTVETLVRVVEKSILEAIRLSTVIGREVDESLDMSLPIFDKNV